MKRDNLKISQKKNLHLKLKIITAFFCANSKYTKMRKITDIQISFNMDNF